MNIALIFAGGVGSRMGNQKTPKQFLKVRGKPILIHTLLNFQNDANIDAICIVIVHNYVEKTRKLLKKYKITKATILVTGGKTGQESIYRGLQAIKTNFPQDNPIVLIHDGVRPIIEKDLIYRNIQSVCEKGSAISSVPAWETTAIVNDKNIIQSITNRQNSWIARAPQSFYLEDILAAHKKAIDEHDNTVIDSCTMIFKYGRTNLAVVPTIPENIKVTTQIDYKLIKGLL